MNHSFTILPPVINDSKRITASVGFVSPMGKPDLYIIVHNKRGWDIPGGHVEQNETALQAFEREIQEETGCDIVAGVQLIAVLESTKNPTTGIAVYKAICKTNPFRPHDEIREVRIVPREELLQLYFGDKAMLQELLELL